MPTKTGKGFVDYVLWGDDGKPLAVVEAKRTQRDARDGQQQAKLYADALEKQFSRRPVIFYTNGYETYLWDDGLGYPPRQVQGFFTKDELFWHIRQRAGRLSLTGTPVNEKIAGRPYQLRAIKRVGETFERDRGRQALLVMATGTGKTRTTVALVDQLVKAGWAQRVLFRYFDSLLLGLTATPKDEIDHNTYKLFAMEDGVPTDSYDLQEAAEGYLVLPKAAKVPLKFMEQASGTTTSRRRRRPSGTPRSGLRTVTSRTRWAGMR